MYGLERCEAYRAAVPYKDRTWGVAGLQNTGTHALFHSVITNCEVPEKLQSVGWQVPWGKHEWLHNTKLTNVSNSDGSSTKPEEVMAITLMKDPIMWMASTCNRPYFDVRIDDRNSATCPSPVSSTNISGFGKTNDHVESLIHLWSRWNREYMDAEATYSLMIRFEDLLFTPKATIQKVCGCLGFPMKSTFKILESDSKAYQGPNGHKDANRTLVLDKYSIKRNAMLKRITPEDRQYIRSVLAETGGEKVANHFHYSLPHEPSLIEQVASMVFSRD